MTTQKADFYCPFTFSRDCPKERCALYSDDARSCVLSPDSLALLIRTAITDAAVEISHHMGDDRK